jgi:hypothetical protein
MLMIAVENGIMEMRKFRIPTPTRGAYPIPHYRQIK